jgi:hypothetical protein
VYSQAGAFFTRCVLTRKPGERGIRNSYWNRRHPVKGQEYGVEICEDDNGNPGDFRPSVYLVYSKHFKFGNAEAQYQIYSAAITPEQASALDGQLRAHDISAHPAPAKEPAKPKAILIKQQPGKTGAC